ncbi:receptor-type tyrosine-protein phosphatase eta-like [Pleurodeles waltl]|uniref:receptor-type tyrosine-protein phosphatase eta-like n=1 Tax=Pleurodeles waltl TaxID=8319 RepID=UPI0037098A4B
MCDIRVPNVTNDLNVTDVSVDSISLSWLPPTGNKSLYFVQVSGNPAFNLTSFSEFVLITNLTPGNHYTFLVSAVAGNGVLGNSSIIAEYTVPNVTNNLKVTDVSVDSISLSWLPPNGNKSLYFVQVLGNPTFNLTSYTEFVLITNLTPGNHYTFLVSAVAGNSVLGNSSIISEYTVPNVTNDLNVTDVSVDSISLSWLPPTGNKSFYFVQVSGNPAFNLTSFSEFVLITNLTPGNHYTFLVSAVAGNGVLGNSSIIAEYTVPNVTNDLNVTDVSVDSISLSWLPPTGNKSFYFVQVSGNPAFNLTSFSEFVLITNLTPGNHYTFLVSAVAGNGVLGNSSIIAEYTVPNVTSNLKVTDVSVDSISLSWLPPTGNKSLYFVQVLGNPTFNLTSYTEFVLITNLTPGNHYTFLVSAVAGNGVLGNSSIISEYTVPNVTNDLNVTDVSVDSISLSWLPPTGNKSLYFVQVSGNPAFNLTSFSEFVLITNLTPGNHYTFLVSAVAGNGVLGNSSIIAEYTVPNVTNNLKVTDVSVDSISLSWLPPNGNKSLYFVQVLGNPTFNLTSYTEFVLITNLTPGNHYTFLVSAVAGNSVLGNSSIISEYTVPNVTNDLNVTDVSVDSISLSWLPPTGNKSFYFVQVSGNPAFNLTSFSEFVLITNLTPGNHYTFLVSAVAGNGVLGNSSIIAEYTVPNVTSNLKVTDVSVDSISLSWLPPTGNKSLYFVQVLGNPTFNLTSYTEFVLITNLTPGNHYTFLVSAVAGNGVLGNSSIISEYTVPNVTNDLNVTDVSVDSISLSWLPPTGNKSFYFVQVSGNPAFNLTSFSEFVLITNLTPGNHYTFLVSAVAGNGVLGNSSIIAEYTGAY